MTRERKHLPDSSALSCLSGAVLYFGAWSGSPTPSMYARHSYNAIVTPRPTLFLAFCVAFLKKERYVRSSAHNFSDFPKVPAAPDPPTADEGHIYPRPAVDMTMARRTDTWTHGRRHATDGRRHTKHSHMMKSQHRRKIGTAKAIIACTKNTTVRELSVRAPLTDDGTVSVSTTTTDGDGVGEEEGMGGWKRGEEDGCSHTKLQGESTTREAGRACVCMYAGEVGGGL